MQHNHSISYTTWEPMNIGLYLESLIFLHVWQPFEADQTRGCLVKLHGISVLMNEPSAPLCQDLQARRLNSSLVVVGLSLVGRAQPGEL